MLYLFLDTDTVGESDGFAQLILRLNSPASSLFSVNYSLSQGTASYANNSGNDFQYLSGTLNFGPGQSTQTLQVPITNDATPEAIEHFWVNLSVPTASQNLVTLSRNDVPVFIVDNDSTQGGTPVISVRDVAVDESTSGFARFVVTLDRPATQAVSVQYQAVNGTAQAGQDYVGASSTLFFAAGETSRVVEIALTDDALQEGAEQFSLQLSAPSGAVLGVSRATATIAANDGPAMPRPTLFIDDPTVSEADGYLSFALRLDAPSDSAITVNYSNAQGSASYANNIGNDFRYVNGTLTFAPGQTLQTIDVPITDDGSTERQESFWMNLSVPTASQSLVTLSRSEVPVFLVDNDSIQGGTPVMSVRDVVVDESTSEFARFVVTLDRPATQTVSVQYQTVNGTATAGQDYLGTSGTLTFVAGDTSQVVEVALTDDALHERSEQFSLQLSAPSGAVLGVPRAAATIVANDAPAMPRPTLFVDDVSVSEADGYAEMVLRLDAPSASTITVNFSNSQGYASYANNSSNDFLYFASSVSFAPGQTSHVIRIPVTDDSSTEGLENFLVNLSVPTASQNLVTLSRSEVQVFLVDNDSIQGGTPMASVRDVVVDESTSEFARFVVTLDRPATQTVSVQYQTVSGTATAGQDYLGTSGTLTFVAGDTSQVVEVALADDSLPEGAEEFRLVLSSPAGVTLGVESATARIGLSDLAAPRPMLYMDDVVASEADGYAEVVLRLDAASSTAFSVNYSNAQGSASYANNSNNDFQYVNGTLNFAPGDTVHTVQVPIFDDTRPESDENFFFNLALPSASQNLVTLSRAQAQVTLVDDDSGNRVLSRGIGDDTYLVASTSDRVVEGPNGGTDTIRTALADHVLPQHVENLTLLGAASINGYGNALDNLLSGNAGNNRLDGGAGIDTAAWSGNASNYQVSRSGGNWVVADRTGADGTDVAVNVERLQFADRTVGVETRAHGSYADIPEALWHFFIVAFDAAPGVTYMDQLAEAHRFGLTVPQIVDIFTSKSQFAEVYPATLSNAQLGVAMAQNIVKDSASAQAKAEAATDIQRSLDGGWTVGKMVYTVFGNLAAKPFDDPTWGGTALQFNNQIEVAKYYTEVLDQATTDLSTLRAVLDPVTPATDVSSDAALATLIGVALFDG